MSEPEAPGGTRRDVDRVRGGRESSAQGAWSRRSPGPVKRVLRNARRGARGPEFLPRRGCLGSRRIRPRIRGSRLWVASTRGEQRAPRPKLRDAAASRYEEEERPESPESPARKALRQLLGKKSRPGRGFHAEASQENAAEDTHSSWTVSGHRVAHVSTGECAISLGEAKLRVLSKTMLASSTGRSRAGRSVPHGHPGEAGGASCCSESGLVAKTDDTTCIRHGGKDCYSCNKASCGERHAPELTRRGRRGRAGG